MSTKNINFHESVKIAQGERQTRMLKLDMELEKLQEDVALSNGFSLQSHNMLLYGVCKECQ